MTQDRNSRIIAAYKAGSTVYQVAEKFGISKSRVSQIVNRAGVSRSPGGWRGVGGRPRGPRPPITWPDCPKHLLEDYRTLAQYMPAAEARETLEAHL